MPGYYQWTDGQYQWTPGHWERAKAGRTYVSGQWTLQGDRYVWVEGHWQ